ncbi:MAG TPA: C39 family peptidase [Candidatus Acidoferrum sp.]|nr:C39 family peptidase [Candidatus Acidoferrum sp.]
MAIAGTSKALPEDLREAVGKLEIYGYRLEQIGNSWTLYFPPGNKRALQQAAFFDQDLATGLLRVLREEEKDREVLHNYKQYDDRWGKLTYGNGPGFSTIGEGGCGPTSLAIILQYLMNNGSRPRNACIGISPAETARYAATHGRLAGAGTDGDAMVRGIGQNWPGFTGSKVSLQAAASLLREGKLILFSSHGSRGYTDSKLLQGEPNISYPHHFMVLSGVEGFPESKRPLFFVADPASRKKVGSMKFIYWDGFSPAAQFWWVYQTSELAGRVCR